jgi:DNA invertase Pin-like site-specific DNA recombinase
VARPGFTELVSRVCSGEVGAIFGIEISGLARSNAEVARLMEFAAITQTLLIDADGIYDPRDVNDRMLLGMKSTIGEVELHVMAQRLAASKKAAAACRSDSSTTRPARSRPRSVTCSPPSPRAARPTAWSPRLPPGAFRCAPMAAPGPDSCGGAA